MSLVDDGDLIRGVGYVAIYSAYLEEALDVLLVALSSPSDSVVDITRKQPSWKIKEIKKRLALLDLQDSQSIEDHLVACELLLEQRHAVVHDRIYVYTAGETMYVPARPERSKRPASSIELYDLANQMQICRSALLRPTYLAIPNAVLRQSPSGEN